MASCGTDLLSSVRGGQVRACGSQFDFGDVATRHDPLSLFPLQGHCTAEAYRLLAQQIETYLESDSQSIPFVSFLTAILGQTLNCSKTKAIFPNGTHENSMNKTKTPFPIHPFLFAIHPILNLYLNNVAFIYFENIIKLSLALLATAFVLLWALKLLIPSLPNRAFVLSVFIFTFFNFSLINDGILLLPGLNSTLSLAITSIIMLGLLIMATYGVIKKPFNISRLTHPLNIISITIIALVLGPLSIYYWSFTQPNWRAVTNQMTGQQVELKVNRSDILPDIYYIIMDGYGRADVLDELYDFDNSPFLTRLSELGFVIAPEARANYPQTTLSLASSLNMSYLDELSGAMGQARDRAPLRDLIQNNSVTRLLREVGYKFILVSSGYAHAIATENSPQADVCYCEDYGLNGLEVGLFNLTPLRYWAPQQIAPYASHRRKVLNGFRYLNELPQVDEPVFVMAHIVAPHPPFIFGANGEEIVPQKPFTLNDGSHFSGTREEYVTGYRNQLVFINRKIEETLETILEKSKTPPVIILQADHGPGSMLVWESAAETKMKERFSILGAYHLPDGGDKLIVPNMTPVNTFRVVFNHYFGAELEYLENESYFSDWEIIYDFFLLTDEQLN